MSHDALEAVIGRAVIDEGFRVMLFADPDSALAGYALTEAELAALRTLDAENLDAFAGGPGSRVVKMLETNHRGMKKTLEC
ncbi:MAG: Franean1_4349 family RiPP [Anaerolineae bacterium]|nr:Franean1_4349 family RiPP [Anaerolineae bacterium]